MPRYIRYIKEEKYDRALAVIRESIPFPSVCGYACLHPCEANCARSQFDQPVSIRLLKRIAAEKGIGGYERETGPAAPSGRKVAVIGSGPGGLTASYYLAGKGHAVTVFEALPLPGGMMRYGIPEYRLPNDIVDKEISFIQENGVIIKTNAPVTSPAELLKDGYDAVLVATGAWSARKSGIKTEDPARIMDGIAFLKNVNSGHKPALGNRVVVVGGGNTAVDTARAALRLGAKEVTVLYRRTRADMPAAPAEVKDAGEEGVRFEFLVAPLEYNNGWLTCIRMSRGDLDESGRRRPAPIEGSNFSMACDTLIEAVGQSADAASLGLEADARGTVKINTGSSGTSRQGVFAAGDAVTGPSSIIQAIARGRLAASSMDTYLGGDGLIAERFAGEPEWCEATEAPPGTLRKLVKMLPVENRLSGFNLVELGYDDKDAVNEANRCLGCDRRDFAVEVSFAFCKECGYCREVCGPGVFTGCDVFNPAGYKPMAAVNTEKCVGCLRCLNVCPDFAITVAKNM